MKQFSGYRFMWVMVLFDLPVLSQKQRKRAQRFRNDLLDMGFEMAQFSVYMKFCGSRAATDTVTKNIEQFVPPEGKVSVMSFTDKQYGGMQVFHGRARVPQESERGQLLLL